MDPSSALKELSLRASRFSINLNGQIDLDNLHDPLHGSSALVHRGVLRRDGTKVAVKTFHNGPPGDINALKRILREVHLWSKLNHENVVCMLGISTDFGSTISIVSDWLALGDAHTYVQDRDNDPRPLLMDIASGLHYLHTHTLGPIFHGDLKGPNVLISDARRALLTDFGFSTLTKSTFTMTISLPRGGSLPWMAPERLDDYDASAESDIWAFGMTMLELFTRLAPFHDSPYTGSIMRRLLQGKLPVRPTEESSCFRMTNAWWDICSSCWQREPMSRPTITEVKHEMNGTRIVSGSEDKSLCLWDAQTGVQLSGSPLRGHTGGVNVVTFSPDGKWIASGSVDSSIFAFSPDGKQIVSGSEDGTICLWNVHA
ncbi:hypothetical protein ID866_6064 [Astraeus odoratus]|nr:hypothetical protein ID866_6064 [Astraeus odoratus]